MNMNYHIGETSIKCPYCDNSCEDSDYAVDFNDRTEFECEYCGKVFWAQAKMDYDTHADCSLNGEEHDWYFPKKEKFPTLLNCHNCPEFKMDDKEQSK